LANVNLTLMSKVSASNLKKFQLCALVSWLVERNMFKEPYNNVIRHFRDYLQNNVENFVERYCQQPETKRWMKCLEMFKIHTVLFEIWPTFEACSTENNENNKVVSKHTTITDTHNQYLK
jgi:hypothetical protein